MNSDGSIDTYLDECFSCNHPKAIGFWKGACIVKKIPQMLTQTAKFINCPSSNAKPCPSLRSANGSYEGTDVCGISMSGFPKMFNTVC